MIAGPQPSPPAAEQDEKSSWNFAAGFELVPGRKIVEKLGGGHDVEVFLVWDAHLFALAVAKVLRPHRLGLPSALAHLEREARLACRLQHPNLGRGYALCLDAPHPHLLLEYVEGPTLRRLVAMDHSPRSSGCPWRPISPPSSSTS